jgi:hypothetical protein
MPNISFQQGVALAMGAYIDPANSENNETFTLVAEGGDTNLNYVNRYGQTVFGRNPRKNNAIDNRLRSLFHYLVTGQAGSAAGIDFAENSAGTQLANLGDIAFLIASTTTAVTDNFSDPIAKEDLVFTGYNATHKQLDYRAGGDINNNSSVSTIERNYHRTGLAIWNKLKK